MEQHLFSKRIAHNSLCRNNGTILSLVIYLLHLFTEQDHRFILSLSINFSELHSKPISKQTQTFNACSNVLLFLLIGSYQCLLSMFKITRKESTKCLFDVSGFRRLFIWNKKNAGLKLAKDIKRGLDKTKMFTHFRKIKMLCPLYLKKCKLT